MVNIGCVLKVLLVLMRILNNAQHWVLIPSYLNLGVYLRRIECVMYLNCFVHIHIHVCQVTMANMDF